MSREVICRVTREHGTNDTFYHAPDNHYYKDENVYLRNEEDKKYKIEVIKLIKEIIKSQDKGNEPIMYSLINKSILTNKDIYNEIIKQKDFLQDKINEIDKNYYGKISFIFSCINNSKGKIRTAGAYKITNKTTNKIYIGESVDIYQRFTQHISELYNGIHHCSLLQEEFNETKDIINFKFEPLFIFDDVNSENENIKEITLYLESAFYLM